MSFNETLCINNTKYKKKLITNQLHLAKIIFTDYRTRESVSE